MPQRGHAYLFHGDGYARWNVDTDLVDVGPVAISKFWKGFPYPSGIHDAVNWGNGKVYFFRDSSYCRWDVANDVMDVAARPIADGWPRFPWPDGIDAAVNWRDGRVFFFKGDKYMAWDVENDVPMIPPTPIADGWPGFPFFNHVDAAVNWGNGKAYFFAGDSYCRWDVERNRLDVAATPVADEWPSLVANPHSPFRNGVHGAVRWGNRLIPRSAWDAAPPTQVTPIAITDRTEFILHISEAPRPLRTDTYEWVREIQRGHMTDPGKGWRDIAYNLLVDRFGNVFEGCGRDVRGSHTPLHNATGIGVCFLGDPSHPSTAQARWQIRQLWRWLSEEAGHELARHGHRDFSSKPCPGDELYDWLRAGMPRN